MTVKLKNIREPRLIEKSVCPNCKHKIGFYVFSDCSCDFCKNVIEKTQFVLKNLKQTIRNESISLLSEHQYDKELYNSNKWKSIIAKKNYSKLTEIEKDIIQFDLQSYYEIEKYLDKFSENKSIPHAVKFCAF